MNLYFFFTVATAFVALNEEVHAGDRRRSGRANLLAFTPNLGKSLELGLDVELPFITVPLTRTLDKFGKEPALLNVHTGALITSGLIGALGLVVGYTFRALFPQLQNTPSKQNHRSDDGEDFLQLFENIKLSYRNASGSKIEAAMPSVITRIDETLLERDVKLAACLQKSICSYLGNASESVKLGQPTSVQRIASAASNISWLLNALTSYAPLYEAVKAGQMQSPAYCDVKYPQCKWPQPDEKIEELLRTHVKFT